MEIEGLIGNEARARIDYTVFVNILVAFYGNIIIGKLFVDGHAVSVH